MTAGLIDQVPYIVEQIRVSIADLRTVWGWLGDLVEPGRDSAPAPLLTDAQLARLDEAAAAERADRAPSSDRLPLGARQFVTAGAYALPATRAGARLGVVDAQAAVHGLVLDAARTVAQFLGDGAVYVGDRSGSASVLDALAWLDGLHRGWVATSAGEVSWCEPPEVLGELRDARAAAAVDHALQQALRIARRAARDDDGSHVAPVDGRCPACGRRSLELDYGSEQELVAGADDERARRRWTVTCISTSCRCSGEGCGCRQAVRYGGRAHAWAYGELAGPYGLWRAMAAAERRRRGPESRVGSETAGHGGWQERRLPRRVGRAVRDLDGVLWWDRERACAQLEVKPENLWDWARRSRNDEGFPRLDPPRRDGRISWYQAEQLLDVDEQVSTATRGRTRPA